MEGSDPAADSVSICMFDIDHFKAYNDTYGHPAGDKVIAAVAQTIKQYLQRTTDFTARYGGEEFVAIILGGEARANFEYLKKSGRGSRSSTSLIRAMFQSG